MPTPGLAAIEHVDFDCVFLPGGPGVKHLRADARVRALVTRHAKADKWIAAICAAPTVLHDAGLLQGRRYTAHFSVANELTEILEGERVVVDGRILTSRGAGTGARFRAAAHREAPLARKSRGNRPLDLRLAASCACD
jgi:4-methyl-5(b-hydroxyethyl)-thiazole monophosphate biosynthesis